MKYVTQVLIILGLGHFLVYLFSGVAGPPRQSTHHVAVAA
ncbi:MAG: hypothetical protein BIFFINMI_02812 [Phycisphaerae bacterium]|nr:hypothetical protein [Phycisphaerae bacterium]